MSNDFFKPSVTVDALILRPAQAHQIEVLLIQRAHPPFQHQWALPGGFIEAHETLLASAQRELQEETGLQLEKLIQFGCYGEPKRDPRGRTLTVAFMGWVETEHSEVQAQDDAKEAQWFPLHALPELAFDHAQILRDGLWDLLCRLQAQHPSPISESTIQQWIPYLQKRLTEKHSG